MTATPSTSAMPPSTMGAKLSLLASDIKISHSVFALPWALLATFLAANGWPKIGQIVLILICMITARTVAMAANRLLDAELDAKNPRTARRAIPSGALSRRFVTASLFTCAMLFIASTAGFGWLYGNWLPLILSVPVLAFISAYPFLKRFSQLCHYYLGASLALAPVCAWVAISGTVTLSPLLMFVTVLLWTAGFDVIYACQDYESDLQTGVVSVPAMFGIPGALWISRITHIACLAAMIALGLLSPTLHVLYFVGVAIAAILLLVEHAIVKPNDLSKVGLAFFTVNGIISVVIGTLGILDVFF